MTRLVRAQLIVIAVILAGLFCLALWPRCDRAQGSVTSAPATQPRAAQPPREVPVWVHPLAAFTACKTVERGVCTGRLYEQAISLGVPIRTWATTMYHPNEPSGVGGGWSTADGGGFRPECVAASTRWYRYWAGHEFWIERQGRVKVGDNGPGWSGKYKFDVPGPSGAYVGWYDRHIGCETRRVVVVRCPRPDRCDCDFAKAYRASVVRP